jgi:hypothetical protein
VILGTGVVQNGMATINISNFSLTHVIKVTITKQNYLPYQGDIPFVLSTGIDSLTEVYFYPNPVKNILQFNNTNNAEVSNLEIFNQLGQKVFSQSAISSSLDLSVLKTGVYLISYEVNQTKVNSKLIKE